MKAYDFYLITKESINSADCYVIVAENRNKSFHTFISLVQIKDNDPFFNKKLMFIKSLMPDFKEEELYVLQQNFDCRFFERGKDFLEFLDREVEDWN